MMKRLQDLSAAHLRRATQIKENIEKLEKELTGILGIPEQMTVGGTIRRHRTMSAAARAKISAAAKARWAKVRAGKK
jgi:DNA polymerase/3'-5' exonuclease PolX